MHPTLAYRTTGLLVLPPPQGTSYCRCRPCEMHPTTIAILRCLACYSAVAAGRHILLLLSLLRGVSCHHYCCRCQVYPTTTRHVTLLLLLRGTSWHGCHRREACHSMRHQRQGEWDAPCGGNSRMDLMAAAAAWRASRWRVTPHGCCANGGRTRLEAATAQWAWQWSRSPAAW